MRSVGGVEPYVLFDVRGGKPEPFPVAEEGEYLGERVHIDVLRVTAVHQS